MATLRGIESERLRRSVVAAIMALLLAGVSAAAALLAGGSQARRNPDLAADTLDTFAFERPGQWHRTTMTAEAAEAAGLAAGTIAFDEDGGFDRRLLVYELINAQSISREPAAIVQAIVQRLGAGKSQGSLPLVQAMRFGPTLAAVTQVRYAEADQEPRHRLLAVATVDGRRHLVVDLSGSRYAAEQNIALMQRILPTVRDNRYSVIDGPVTIDGATIDPMPQLLALRKANDAEGEKVIFVPAAEARFALLQALPLDVSVPFDLTNARIAGTADDISSVPVDMLMALDAALQTTPLSRLSAAMVWRFWRATEVVPAAQFVDAVRLSPTRTMYEMTLNLAKRLPTYRSLSGVLIDDRRAVLIEAIAEREAAGHAQIAARLIGQNLRAAESPPPPATSETATPSPNAPPPPEPAS